MVSVDRIVIADDFSHNALPILGIVAACCILGAVIGYFCRAAHIPRIVASILGSVALLAVLDWSAGRLHWWWHTPGEVLLYYLGPYVYLMLAPTWLVAHLVSRRVLRASTI